MKEQCGLGRRIASRCTAVDTGHYPNRKATCFPGRTKPAFNSSPVSTARSPSADKTTVAILRGDKIRGDNTPENSPQARSFLGAAFKLSSSIVSPSSGSAPTADWSVCQRQNRTASPLPIPLAIASILSFMEDREGNIWVGTETGGLHILRDERFRTLGTRDGLSSDATTTVVEDNAGTLWVGTSGSGLERHHPQRSSDHQSQNTTGARRPLERRHSLARGSAERRSVGRHSRRP